MYYISTGQQVLPDSNGAILSFTSVYVTSENLNQEFGQS